MLSDLEIAIEYVEKQEEFYYIIAYTSQRHKDK